MATNLLSEVSTIIYTTMAIDSVRSAGGGVIHYLGGHSLFRMTILPPNSGVGGGGGVVRQMKEREFCPYNDEHTTTAKWRY